METCWSPQDGFGVEPLFPQHVSTWSRHCFLGLAVASSLSLGYLLDQSGSKRLPLQLIPFRNPLLDRGCGHHSLGYLSSAYVDSLVFLLAYYQHSIIPVSFFASDYQL